MKYIIRIFVIIGLITLSVKTQAQINFGVRLGLNANNVNKALAAQGIEKDNKMRIAYHFGGVIDYEYNDKINFQTGLLFSSKGYKWSIIDENLDNNNSFHGDYVNIYNYLEIPVNTIYKINNFQINAGPYVAFGIGSKHKYDWAFEIPVAGISGAVGEQDLPYRAFDFGVNIGAGYKIKNILFNIDYSLGLMDIKTSDYLYGDGKHRVIMFSASYYFNK